ncbi:Rne/Rng family ribonuclease [Nonomuraea sp. NPDC049684]|uniref:Rne/Rng family ribonuclease n=1 Tax=Nonomuraea sp. NPDC049684 TaxID=3364356 RepID=UPI0037AC9E03
MLDNEPNAGATGPDGETTEQPKVTRRRRSASRPAGPPPELPEEPAATAPITVAAAQAAPSVADVQPVQTNAVQRAAGEPAPDAGRGRRTRARAAAPEAPTGQAGAAEGGPAGVQAQAGAPESAVAGAAAPQGASAVGGAPEGAATGVGAPQGVATGVGAPEGAVTGVGAPRGAGAVVPEGPAPQQAESPAASHAGTSAEPAVESAVEPVVAPVVERREAAGRVAGAAEPVVAPVVRSPGAPEAESPAYAGGPAGAGEVASVVEAAVAEAAVEAADVPEEKPKRATRTRSTATTTRRRTTKKAEPEVAGALPEEEAEAPKRRRTRKKAEEVVVEAPAGADVEVVATPSDVEVAVTVPEAAEEADEDILEILPEDEPLDDEPAGEDLDEDVDRPSLLADPFGLNARRHDEPGTAFQRPAAIFAPLFQAPDPSQGKPAVIRRPEPEPEPEEIEELVDETLVEDEGDVDTSEEQEEEEGGGRRRRRRRGGRGRGKSRERDEAEDGEEGDEEEGEDQGEEAQEEEAAGSRRRRRRRRRGTEETLEPSSDDPPNTVVRIRAPRSGRAASLETATDGVQSVRGSTRLEAKKQRRREGRELGRRRPPIITESEFLARRESVDRMMVVRRQGDRTQIAVLEDGVLVEHYVNREASQSYVGNVYLGKVQNVLPSMEAAFVDIGKGRNAVLYAGEVNFDTAGLEGQPKRIESALKSGQSVLVQVTKDPIGHKGARLTSQISLPGRYLVYVPDGSMTGISRKLPDKERTRLKSILKKVMPENAGVIVRTAAEGASEDELARDVARLSAQWESIQKKAKSASPPELLSAEPDLTIRVVRDVFNEDFTSLVVQGDDAWDTVDDYVKYVAPHLAERLSRWDTGQGDVFESYRIDEQLGKALERKVWLPSGGSLVIDRTEAMTVVDVNTGKFTGQGGNLEETVTRNNLEAAEEIVRQLRLRDIGGIIVIDFIDMVLESNRDLVLRRLLECLARDRTKHQVAEVTSLGLVQMTRKRVGQGLLEAFSTACECCNGRGLIVSTEPVETKPEPRGTQGKMAIEKAVSDKVSAAKDSGSRDTVTGALDDVPAEDDQASQTSGRGRRRSRRAKSAE